MTTTAQIIADLQAENEALRKDAERWRYARKFLSIEDIERWASEMKGHVPSEEENLKADATIDAAMKGQ